MAIFPVILFVLIFLFLANVVICDMVKSMCEESAVRPIRYESQGLFGVLTPIETTPENADGYGRICIKSREPNFWSILENLKYVVEMGGRNEI